MTTTSLRRVHCVDNEKRESALVLSSVHNTGTPTSQPPSPKTVDAAGCSGTQNLGIANHSTKSIASTVVSTLSSNKATSQSSSSSFNSFSSSTQSTSSAHMTGITTWPRRHGGRRQKQPQHEPQQRRRRFSVPKLLWLSSSSSSSKRKKTIITTLAPISDFTTTTFSSNSVTQNPLAKSPPKSLNSISTDPAYSTVVQDFAASLSTTQSVEVSDEAWGIAPNDSEQHSNAEESPISELEDQGESDVPCLQLSNASLSSSSSSSSPTCGSSNKEGELMSLFDSTTDRLTLTSSQEKEASKHLDAALSYFSREELEDCLKAIDLGFHALTVASNDVKSCPVYWKLLQLQAEVLCRMGQYADSLTKYQLVLEYILSYREEETDRSNNHVNGSSKPVQQEPENDDSESADSILPCTPADVANLFYICGRLSVQLGLYEQAVEYCLQELEVTRAVVVEASSTTAGSTNHYVEQQVAVSKIYHELARIHRQGLGDLSKALKYYEQALRIEVLLWQDVQVKSKSCLHCRRSTTRPPKQQQTYCRTHATALQEARLAVEETKRSMGRIHFEMGNMELAMQLSIR